MEENNIRGPYTRTQWNTMLLLKQGLDYMVSSKKPKFKDEIEKDKLRLKKYLNRAA